jgi:putative Mg2+ transporter-C (MgtC) family protein
MDWSSTPGGPLEAFARLATATVVGGALGANRRLREKPAGVRTHALVSLGSALTIVTSIAVAGPDVGAVTRAVQGVLAGVGFLGGGVILKGTSQQESVRGLTTAASVWVAATLGVACGAGQWRVALLALGLTLFILVAGGPVERRLQRAARRRLPAGVRSAWQERSSQDRRGTPAATPSVDAVAADAAPPTERAPR